MSISMEDKRKQVQLAVAQIEKEFGKGSIMTLEEDAKVDIDIIPTGCLSLDIATGIGGIPRGRILEVYGPESSGKTTLTLHMIAEAQKAGGFAAFIDAEHALDPVYAGNIGVDLKNLYVSQPDNGEQALDITEELVKSGRQFDLRKDLQVRSTHGAHEIDHVGIDRAKATNQRDGHREEGRQHNEDDLGSEPVAKP